MIHLLKLEWKKAKNYRILQVLFIMYVVTLPLIFSIGKRFNSLPKEIISSDTFYMFPTVWSYLAYMGSWLVYFLLGYMAVVFVTNEYQNKTFRQNIIAGLTREEFYFSKVAAIIGLSLLATIYFIIVGLIYGFLHTETTYWSKIIQEADMIPRYFLMCLGYTSFGLLVGLLIKRTGIALFFYLFFILAIEPMLRYVIHPKIMDNRSSLFYPMNAFEDLTPFPFAEKIGRFADDMEMSYDMFLSPGEAIITSIVYIALFLGLTYYLIKKINL